MKRKIKNVIRLILMWFTYPRELAVAVNRALTNEDLNEVIAKKGW